MINTILFATDLGAFTSHSLLHVESLAKQFNAKVVILHAVLPLGNYASAMVKTHLPNNVVPQFECTASPEALKALREQIFEVLLGNLGEDELIERVADIVVEVGPPANVILQEAQATKADLIVIGSHGVDAIDSAVLGSVASKVLQLAKVPVYMVPMVNPKHYRRRGSYDWTRQ